MQVASRSIESNPATAGKKVNLTFGEMFVPS